MKRKANILLLIFIMVLIGSMFGIQASRASAHRPVDISQTEDLDKDTQVAFSQFNQALSTWESSVVQPGWVRARYTERSFNTAEQTASPDIQYPDSAEVEIWFHFNSEHLVDQEIDFIVVNGRKLLSSIIYQGEYHGLSEKFSPQPQEPYSPSLSFYLTAVTPEAAAAEGWRLEVSKMVSHQEDSEVVQYILTRTLPVQASDNTVHNGNSIGSRNIVTMDHSSGAILKIDNYELVSDANETLVSSITDIAMEPVASLPPELQWFFDHYDQLIWETYINEFEEGI